MIGDCKNWSANATIRCRFPAKAFDNSYLRFLGKVSTTVIWGFLQALKPPSSHQQILKLQFTCFIFHYLTDSGKLGNQSIKKDCIFWATNETSEPRNSIAMFVWLMHIFVCRVSYPHLPSVATIMLLWFGEDFGILALPWTGVLPTPLPVLSG